MIIHRAKRRFLVRDQCLGSGYFKVEYFIDKYKDGPFIEWYKDGQIFRICYDRNNKLHRYGRPEQKIWNNKVQLLELCYHVYNSNYKVDGPTYIEWHPNGQLKLIEYDYRQSQWYFGLRRYYGPSDMKISKSGQIEKYYLRDY